MGDSEQFQLTKKDFYEVNAVITRKGNLYDYVFETEDLSEQVSRIERIDTLVSTNIITRNQEDDLTYLIPDFLSQIEEICCGSINIYFLSTLVDKSFITEWLLGIDSLDDMTIVIVDDYLDPRLLRISAYLAKKKTNWILIKPVGLTAMVGPYFNSNRPDAPCYHCLHTRLVQNNPVREWCRRHTKSDSQLAVPVMVSHVSIRHALENFTRCYLQHLHDRPDRDNIIYTINPDVADTQVGKFHNVIKRPQCSGCGDSDLFKKMNDIPIHLLDCIIHDDTDGGYRNIAREVTLDNNDKLISPVSGIISELKNITDDENPDEMAIYQAAYYQTTYNEKTITADTFVQLSLGKGISKKQAMSSAIGEAIERQAAQFNGEESFILSTPKKLDNRAFQPQSLAQFSQAQYKTFAHFEATSLDNPQWVCEYSENTPIHWVRGWSLTKQEHVYFPAAFCFANTPFTDHKYSLYTHNGNAAGNTQEEAILQGALEVIERDAVAIWWYNQIPRPEIALDVVPQDTLKIISKTLSADWDYWLLDISHDISVVSCVAVGRHKESEKFVLGFGSHMEVLIACQRALTEMFQLITIKDKVTGPFDFNNIPPHPFMFPRRHSATKKATDFNTIETNNIREGILYLMKTLTNCGLELCVVSYSRADISLKTLKVIIPGLSHFWPQLANERLYDVPVRLGWLSQRLKEEELNPLELYL